MNDTSGPAIDRSGAKAWRECLDVIRDNVSEQVFTTWFAPIRPIGIQGGPDELKLIVQVPSRFFYEWIEDQYPDLLRKTVSRVLGSQARLVYDIIIESAGESPSGSGGSSIQIPSRRPAIEPISVDTPRTTPSPVPSDTDPMLRDADAASIGNHFVIPGVRRPPVSTNLNESYTFERFIEGDCNRLARSAALAIAQQPGKTQFNPFMIYGGVGLGKTHLIQAIGNYVRAHHKAQSIMYVSSERFTTEFVQAIQYNRASDFSGFYRSIDLLVIDDAQFFGGKEKTQEEFFHIFNALHQSGKQIVLSADRPPRDIDGIEERLLSRFQWGLSADMKPPDLETRIAILQRKAEDDGLTIDQEIIEFIAHNIKSNIRELEGALIRLLAATTLDNRTLDLSLAKEILRDLIKDTQVNLSIDEIQRVVCEYFDIVVDLVRAKTRKREVVQARQIAMFFCKELTQHSLKTIGLHFGGRDHSTVIHANQSVLNQIDTDHKYRQTIDEIRHKLELRSR